MSHSQRRTQLIFVKVRRHQSPTLRQGVRAHKAGRCPDVLTNRWDEETAMRQILFAFGVVAPAAQQAMAADPAKINWPTVPVSNIALFYPGWSLYEWLRSLATRARRDEVEMNAVKLP
jgi:hypothetical protein